MTGSWSLRQDGYQFTSEYLRGANRDVAEDYLWPIPVFERFREQSSVHIDSVLISPGDVLEYCGHEYEEFLLVIAVLPHPAAMTETGTISLSDRLLLYSSNAETYRIFDAGHCTATPEENKPPEIVHPTGTYVIHTNASDLVSGMGDSPPDVTYPPRPRVEVDNQVNHRTENAYPHTDSSSPIRPVPARAGDTKLIDDLLYTIHQGDAEQTLRGFPDDSIHGWVTSPPYFQQRDYDVDEQLGLEDSVNAYLESLLTVINQLMRVTHESGIGWIILDDSYHNGELAGIPEQLHEEIRVEGYKIVHHSPWVKSNPKPEPVENRLSHAHEYVIAITNNESNHYFNKHGLEETTDVFSTTVGNTDTDHDAVFPVALPKQLIKASVPEKVCEECGEPFEQTYDVTDIRDLPDDRPQAERAIELAEKHDLTDEHLRALRSVGLSDTGQSKRTQDGSGQNSDSVEALANEATDVLGSYSREFTSAKKKPTGFEQTCDCSNPETKPGIVLDPFTGSGTTCVAAKQLNRRWIGVELNEEYVTIAESRIGTDVTNPDQLTEKSQETLTNFKN